MARRRSWTDDDLLTALDGATSISEVVRRLRRAHGGAAFVTVRSRIEQLELDVPTSRGASRSSDPSRELSRVTAGSRRWTDAQLAEAVSQAGSLKQVFDLLGLAVGGSQWEVLRARIKALGLDTSHWRHPLCSARGHSLQGCIRVLAAQDLGSLAASCSSRAELLRRLELPVTATSYQALRIALDRAGIPSDALGGRRGGGTPVTPLDEILVAGSGWTNTARLRERLIEEGIKAARCASCGIDRWCGQPAPLQLDHIDGDRSNHRIENLRILCANCHALTATWGSRNRGQRNREGTAG